MYITTSSNLCSIYICSTPKFKLTPLLCTHVYSYVLWKVHPPGSFYDGWTKLALHRPIRDSRQRVPWTYLVLNPKVFSKLLTLLEEF